MNAKAGDKITMKAQRALARAHGGHLRHIDIQDVVYAKTKGEQGRWFCVDCGELSQNNFDASCHERANPSHRMAWWNFAATRIEEP